MSRTTKRIVTIISLVLLTVFLVAIIGNVTNGFDSLFKPDEWGKKELNPDNLIKLPYLLETEKTVSMEEGVEITVNDDGSIKVKGENKTTSDIEVEICKVKLAAGTYTFTSGVNGCSASRYYLKAGNHYADFNTNTFILSAEEELTVKLVIKPDESINVTFKPVIVAGEKSGSFYAD